MKRSRIIMLVILFITLILGGVAIWLGLRLGKEEEVTPEESEAASEEVTNADTLKTQAQREEFNRKWQTFIADETKTWRDYVEYAMGEGARYECTRVIMSNVGAESLYGCDLNALFVIYDLPTYISTQPIGPQDPNLNAVLNELITDSGLLQKAAEMDIITLDETFFNSPSKDMFERFSKVETARVAIGDQFVKRVDFEAVVIYFHNEYDPQIPLEQAKEAAKTKMDILYGRLETGEITMRQAGEEIINDNIQGDTTGVSLTQLDRLYKENAYIEVIGHEFGERIFKDEVYDEELRSLGEGQMSTVRLCKDYKFTPEELFEANGETTEFPLVDSCYIIFKVNKITFGLGREFSGDTLEEVEDSIQDNYDQAVDYNL
ncbi:hypothetical protein JW766_00455 [Candidatus Dojkabacteria bacterium]|nr:hypothetical protein [Candidatus Dojkabacteria bacterium]